jgi:hypothetical protein
MKTPWMIMADQVKSLDAALAAGRISADQYGAAQQKAAYVAQGAYAGAAASIGSSLEQVFGQSKAVAIGMALINSYQAFTNAMANIPAPFNVPAAAAALASGLAQVASIRKTTKSSGGGGGSGGGAAASGGGQVQQSQMMTVNLHGKSFGRDQVYDLIDQINSATADGKQLIIRRGAMV